MSQIPAARQGELNAVPSDRLRSAAEAVLVVADEPITAASLSESLGLDENATEKLLESLAAEYAGHEGQGRPRGFILRRVAGGWRLASAPEFSDIVERFVIGGATARLSQAALETLAVIAYRQPVTRGRVAAIRGVILYRTTAEFLEYLGLNSLEDLPPLAPYLPDTAVLDDIENEMSERNHQ